MSKTAIITGADGGMGTEITKAVAKAGYTVYMICYTSEKGENKKEQIIQETGNSNIHVVKTDLSSMQSVINATKIIMSHTNSIELLMNNAGTMCTHFMQTSDGFERTVAVNYLSHFLLTLKLLPLMHKGSRIVNMISCTYKIGKIDTCFFTNGRKGSFWRIPIYSNSKLALWLFTRELSLRTRNDGIIVNAADPGIVSTDIIRMQMWFDPITDIIFRPCIRTPKQGAQTAIHLLLDKETGNTTGCMFASCKMKNVKTRFMYHPQAMELWNNTITALNKFI